MRKCRLQVTNFLHFNIFGFCIADPCQEIWKFNSVSNTENSSGNGNLVKTKLLKWRIKSEMSMFEFQ